VQTLVAVLCLIRVYALYNHSRRVLGFLVFIVLMSFAAAVGAFIACQLTGGGLIPVLPGLSSPIQVMGCSQFTPLVGGRFTAIPWTGVLAFDSVVFSLTLYKAFTMGRGIQLLDVIVRDGTVYFFTLFVINLASIVNLLHSPSFLRSSAQTLTNVLSTTLVSRLVLNLREQKSTLVFLPTTLETENRFQAALPVALQSMASVGTHPSVRPNNLTYETNAFGADHDKMREVR